MGEQRADEPFAAVGTSQVGAPALSTVPQGGPAITVDHGNVLKAAKIIQDALDNEGTAILGKLSALRVIAPGADPVSVQAAAEWNARLVTDPDSYTVRVQQYLQSLSTLVDNLRTSALQYGYSEQQVADAFAGQGQ
jgi:hypothetical protein